MVQVNNGDGKTRDTAIIIMSAEDQRDGKDYICNYLTDRKFEYGNAEYSTLIEEDGFEAQYVLFRKDGREIWFDWTWLYNFMR
jgi:hypothetical protein